MPLAVHEAPFVEEGNLQGLFEAIDVIVEKKPKYLLHCHEPLTRNFTSPEILAQLKTDLTWLCDQVLSAIRRGDNNATIQQANLIPPDLLAPSRRRARSLSPPARTRHRSPVRPERRLLAGRPERNHPSEQRRPCRN